MSRANVQAQQVKVDLAKPTSNLRNQYSADIQIELGRAFEVASAIEKALRTETPETLEQFLTRALTVIFDRVEESCMWVTPAADFLTPTCIYSESHMIQIYTKKGDTTHGGRTIGISMPSLPRSEISSAHECMRQFGFLPGQNSSTATENRGLHGLDIRVVVGLVCCLLKNTAAISVKNEILCWFDHTKNEGKYVKRKLHSADDLADCLKSVIAHEPIKIDCVILAANEDRALLAVCRLPYRKVCLSVYKLSKLGSKKESKIRERLKSSGFVWRVDQNPSGENQDWSGPENLELLTATVRQILEVHGASLESNALQVGFLWQPFFS